MLIPHRQLSPEALQGIIDEFITRDGTDYGEMEPTLAHKRSRIRKLLDKGLAFVVYDEVEGSVNIVGRDHPAVAAQ
jgi:uncharacterized protein